MNTPTLPKCLTRPEIDSRRARALDLDVRADAHADGGPGPGSDWSHRLSRRSRALRRSAVRDLLEIASRPEIISFAGGLPAPELFPVAEVEAATTSVLARHGARALQYGATAGIDELRDWIARDLSGGGMRWGREHIVITSGAQQALDLLGRVLIDEGDVVLVEHPTYLALLSAWGQLGARFKGLPGDANGLRIEAVPSVPGTGAKWLYTIPNFQNPQGTTLARERRQELVIRARGAGIGLVEDDPYGDLWYDTPPDRSLWSVDAETNLGVGNVIRVGTFSKVLAPGLRVGWVAAPRFVAERVELAKQSADLHTSTLNQWLALELWKNGTLEAQRARIRAEYRTRRDAMLAALDRHLRSDAIWTRPGGGMFVWVTLAADLDTTSILRRALEREVAFVPGESFHLDGQGRNTLRLNFTHTPPDRIEEGVRRLAAACREVRTG